MLHFLETARDEGAWQELLKEGRRLWVPSWVFGMPISELGCSSSSNLALLLLTLLCRSDLP